MGRLLDANTLLDKLPYPTDYAESEFYGKVLDVIEEIPTAYDVDKVVEQLEAFRLSAQVEAINAQQHGNTAKNIAYTCAVTAIEFAIETVKGEQNGD